MRGNRLILTAIIPVLALTMCIGVYANETELSVTSADEVIYEMIDIGGADDAEVYFENQSGGSYAGYRQKDYLIWGTSTQYRFALSKASVAEHLENGILYGKDETPFSMPLEKAVAVDSRYSPSVEIELLGGLFSKLHILTANIEKGSGFSATVHYTDGSSETTDINMYGKSAGNEEDLVCTVRWHECWNDKSPVFGGAGGAFDLCAYTVNITRNKPVSSVTFSTSNSIVCPKILAVTLETPIIAEMKAFVSEKLSDLEALKTDLDSVILVSDLISLMEKNNINLDNIENYDIFMEMKNNWVSIKKYSVSTEGDFVSVMLEMTVPLQPVTSADIKLSRAGETVNAYTVTQPEDNNILVSFRHKLDFVSEYRLEVSKDITSANNSEYTLGTPTIIKFVPGPLAQIESFTIETDSTVVSSIGDAAGKTVTAKAEVKGESDCGILIAYYGADGVMKIVLTEMCSLGVSNQYTAKAQIELPNTVAGASLECYLVNNCEDMKLIYPKRIIK